MGRKAQLQVKSSSVRQSNDKGAGFGQAGRERVKMLKCAVHVIG